MDKPRQKSTFEVWQYWAKALSRQLKLVSDVYIQHEHDNGEDTTAALLARLNLFIDPVSHAHELAAQNYDVKGSVTRLYLLSLTMLEGIFRDAIKALPQISEDMQRLLDSPYAGNCKGRLASDIFKGPHGSANEGIGRGVSDEQGNIAWELARLLDDAEVGGENYFKIGLAGVDDPHAAPAADDHGGATRHDLAAPRKKITVTGMQ